MIMRSLHQASEDMSYLEGSIKLAITMLFVPVPILVLTLGGFWLDYYKFDTGPLLSAVGIILGTFFAFLGVYQIIVYGHERRNK